MSEQITNKKSLVAKLQKTKPIITPTHEPCSTCGTMTYRKRNNKPLCIICESKIGEYS